MKLSGWATIGVAILVVLSACRAPTAENLNLVRDPLPPFAAADGAKFKTTTAPLRDLVALTEQYRQVQVPTAVEQPETAVGESQIFWYEDQANELQVQTSARLVAQSEGLNMWVEEGVDVEADVIEKAMATLEQRVFPTNQKLFGRENSPGIDGDERLNILHVAEMGGGVIGYFSSADGFPSEVNPFSNGRDMFYINLEFVDIGSDDYFDVVAHEYQHMIHWHIDRSEMTWLNEGLSELAAAVNGYGESDHLDTFLAEPDTPLTYFDYEGGDYGAAYLFSRYLYERFGPEFIFELVQEPLDSGRGIEAVLSRRGIGISFEQLFSEWVTHAFGSAAGLIPAEPSELDGVLDQVAFPNSFAVQKIRGGDVVRTQVQQFGVDFWQLQGRRPFTVSFAGSTQVPLMTSGPSEGQRMWSTVPGDDSMCTLTRRFDVGGIEAATLQFDLWYDIETGWDFGYVAVSQDGSSWTTLQTTATSAANPRGTNLGHGYTGISGSGRDPVWIEQTADLTPFLGGETLWIRFLYVTDDAIFEQGMSVDSIRIPELNYADSAEDEDGGWEADGFIRHHNVLPQTYLAQLILIDRNGRYSARPLEIAADQSGSWYIPLDSRWTKAVIAISGSANTTIHPSVYELKVDS